MGMKNLTLRALPGLCSVYLLSLVLMPINAQAIDSLAAPNQNAPLASLSNNPVDIGTAIKEHVVSFKMASVPNDAVLRLQFGVVKTGSCRKTYEATTVRVNNESVASLDFRNYRPGAEKDINVPIPDGVLVVGDNQLKIRTGSCKFDIDVMRLDNLTIVVQK